MKKYRMETWGISIWIGDVQVGAAVGCLPFDLCGGSHWPPMALRVGSEFVADDFVLSL